MPAAERRAFISAGLPILLESATSLLTASRKLQDSPREAEILEGQAEEECAKALMLIDLMRCPSRLLAERIGPMMRWFYDHLARLIYAEAQSWRPTNVGELQSYIDSQRRSHYVEGEYGEYIMPNWTLFRRESALYADVAADESGELQWLSPVRFATGLGHLTPMSYKIVEALSAFGIFTPAGLEVLNNIWGDCPVDATTRWEITRDNYEPLARSLEAAGLITDQAGEAHASLIADYWQLPMYTLDFSRIDVPLRDLLDQQEAQYLHV